MVEECTGRFVGGFGSIVEVLRVETDRTLAPLLLLGYLYTARLGRLKVSRQRLVARILREPLGYQ